MNRDKGLQLYNIKELLNNKYVIPIYQRNFAWSEGEIRQLILDIADASENTDNYYIGTLITYDRGNNLFEIIDGQQRLTTLSILLSLIKNKYKDEYKKYISKSYSLNLTFDSRKNSTYTLKALYDKDENDIEKYISENQNSITEGYIICKKVLTEILKEKFRNNEAKFFEYLFNNVKILQVLVLEDTDLNHYFEIMNSRGEQLEMHEILKARLLDKLENENDKFIFNLIWEACSNMERYIQFGFESKLRNDIFKSDWNSLINEDEIYIKERIKRFIGKSSQIPPIYSAIKIKGKKAYEYARNGENVSLKPREIEIFNIDDIDVNLRKRQVSFVVSCTKGTYIRSVVHDIGIKLGCGATMIELKRLKTGDFDINDSIDLYEFLNLEYLDMLDKIVSIEELYKDSKKINLKDKDYDKFLNGIAIKTDVPNGIVRVYENLRYKGLGKVNDNLLKRFIIE